MTWGCVLRERDVGTVYYGGADGPFNSTSSAAQTGTRVRGAAMLRLGGWDAVTVVLPPRVNTRKRVNVPIDHNDVFIMVVYAESPPTKKGARQRA